MARLDELEARGDQTARLEQQLIAEFLERHGVSASRLNELPPDEAHRLLKEASAYASGRLAEVDSRAHYVHELHHND